MRKSDTPLRGADDNGGRKGRRRGCHRRRRTRSPELAARWTRRPGVSTPLPPRRATLVLDAGLRTGRGEGPIRGGVSIGRCAACYRVDWPPKNPSSRPRPRPAPPPCAPQGPGQNPGKGRPRRRRGRSWIFFAGKGHFARARWTQETRGRRRNARLCDRGALLRRLRALGGDGVPQAIHAEGHPPRRERVSAPQRASLHCAWAPPAVCGPATAARVRSARVKVPSSFADRPARPLALRPRRAEWARRR